MKKLLFIPVLFLSFLGLVACKNEENNIKTIKIVAPAGAPALSQVLIAHNSKSKDYTIGGYNISFEVVNGADAVTAAITSKSHDVIIAPINLGAKLYKNNNTYKYAANITDGNLYFASTSPFELEDLNTKNLVFFGEGTINQVVVHEVLSYNNITNTNITYDIANTATTMQMLVADENENTVYLVAEPNLTQAKIKLEEQGKTVYKIDVQEEFKKATSGLDFLQAGVFVRNDLDKDFVEAYLEVLEDSISEINEDPDTASAYYEELGYSVAKEAIPGCNLKFRLAGSCQDSLNELVSLADSLLPDKNLFGGPIADDFYF